LPTDQVDLVVEVFRMLADPTRVQVLWALVGREMSVNDLADHVGKPGASVSQHLAKLRMARLHAGPGVPGPNPDATELATLNPKPTFAADSTPARSTGRPA
jgi:hypothetical protein